MPRRKRTSKRRRSELQPWEAFHLRAGPPFCLNGESFWRPGHPWSSDEEAREVFEQHRDDPDLDADSWAYLRFVEKLDPEEAYDRHLAMIHRRVGAHRRAA
jgi:hypothetical protein